MKKRRSYRQEIELAKHLALDAGEAIRRIYDRFERIADAPADISTEADKLSQEIVLGGISKAFPQDGLCAEEDTPALAAAPANSDRFWVVDPIDGTRGFATKNGEYSIGIALVEDGLPVVGVVYEPAIDRLWSVTAGSTTPASCRRPAAVDKNYCLISLTPQMEYACAAISRSQKSAGEQKFMESFGIGRCIQTYSAQIKLAMVASGEVDFYVGDYLTLADWDVCAGHLLVERAGGTVTDVDGQPIRYDGSGKSLKGRGIVASNGALHDDILEVISSGRFKF